MFKSLTLLIFLFLLPTGLAAQSNQSFIIKADDLSHPLTFTELKQSGPHELNLIRRFANEKEEKILRIAEAVYPLAESVKGAQPNNKQANIAREWWCSSFDGVRIPYAITKSAVAYYLDVADGFRTNNPRAPLSPKMTSSFLGYSAKLTWKSGYKVGPTEFKKVFVVSLDLSWMQYCDPLCAMMFTTTRNVVVKEDGSVLAIENDACARFVVS